MSTPERILVVEDDDALRVFLEERLRESGYEVAVAGDASEALEILAHSTLDVVITDVVMPGMKGSELLAVLHHRYPDIPVVLITAFGSIEAAVEAVKAGAFDYVAKPFHMDKFLETVGRALDERRLHTALLQLGDEAQPAGDFTLIAQSPAMQRAQSLLRRAAGADIPVLLLGESGTGKELMARTLHAQSPRATHPFVAVNCQAIPETLLESQLFGHRRGAFTDAREDSLGLVREAEGGTLLLDEIGDMPLSLQGKLLRVLQEREVHPLGAPAPVPVDIRVVAATHRDLEALVAAGRFRQDLYFRLNVVVIPVPPLRERPEDLLPLVAHFLSKHSRRLGRPMCTVSTAAMEILRRHPWPGNVRELENVIERALVLGSGQRIRAEDLPEEMRQSTSPIARQPSLRALSEVEREQILRTLRAVGGNKTAAARILGLDRKTLYRKLEQYGIRFQSS